MSIFFSRLGKFSAIVSSNMFSFPFFSSCLSCTPIMWMLFHLMLPYRFLKLPSLFNILFCFCCFVWVSSTVLSSRSLVLSSASSSLQLNPSSVFFSLVTVFFSSVISFCIFVVVEVLSVFIHSSEVSEHLYDHSFEFYQVKCLYLFH